MSNLDYYNSRIKEIEQIKDDQIIQPGNIPVDIYSAEADALYKVALHDKEALIKAKLDWAKVEDILPLAGALREAHTRWVVQRFNKQETGKLWKEKSIEIFVTRSSLLHEFRFAYRNNTQVLGRINTIAGSQSYPAMIQDLNDLVYIGKQNTAELAAIAFDLGSLDKVAELAVETAGILASATVEGDYSAAKKIRDQAFTCLKIVVDEVCSFGQYLFWKDEAKKRGYSSSYLRRVRRKRTRENEDDVQAMAEAGGDSDVD